MRPRHVVLAALTCATIACGFIIGIDDRRLDEELEAGADASDGAADVVGEASADTSAADVDAGACPEACTSCVDNRCLIDCPGAKCAKSPIVCPPAMICRITCDGDAGKACENIDVDCSRAKSCRIDCNGVKDTCNDMKVNAGQAPLCITCKGANSACDQMTCTADAGCTRICNGGVGGACTANTCSSACTGGSACP